ncbi:MAG: hypothetical protein EON85_07020, partial [Brevundimonas sp.]
MSADEFDPAIERLFARTPTMPDASLFTAEVEQRLHNGSRVRFICLSVAGVVGGVFAAREVVSINFSAERDPANALGQGLQAVSINAHNAVQSGLDQVGMGSLDLGSMSGMQMFWIV